MSSASSSSSSTVMKSCLDVLRRTDPRDTEKHLGNLSKLISNNDIIEELYQRIDVPLKICKDAEADGRLFLHCDHNRDGDSHRSPWSNTYFPPLEDGFLPSEQLRKLELYANEVWDVYRELYYGKGGSVSSVYLWDKDEKDAEEEKTGKSSVGAAGFAGCFLIQKNVGAGKNNNNSSETKEGGSESWGNWNSIHVVDVGNVKGGKCQYKLTTTILLSLAPSGYASTSVSGSLTRHNVRECNISPSSSTSADDGSGSISSSHIVNIGKFIEDVESDMRSEMDSLYIQKTRNIVETIRRDNALNSSTQGQEHTKMLNDAVLAMAVNRKAN